MIFQFIVNPGSGEDEQDVQALIREYFAGSEHKTHVLELKREISPDEIKSEIARNGPDRVIGAGGDGTIKLIAECLFDQKIPLGILPTGSANGMARELGIPLDISEALGVAVSGVPTLIHAVSVNDEFCIHLADLGFNAYLVKKFDSLSQRGKLGYARAAWHALWSHRKMQVELEIGDNKIESEAAMVVVANGTMYGTGVRINPVGTLADDLFEVVLVKDYSLLEVLKMRFTHTGFNPKKVEFFQTRRLRVRSRHRVHLQVDGEYQGKVNTLEAHLLPAAIQLILPPGHEI